MHRHNGRCSRRQSPADEGHTMFDLAPIGRALGGAIGAMREKQASTPAAPPQPASANASATVTVESPQQSPPRCETREEVAPTAGGPVMVCQVSNGFDPTATIVLLAAGGAAAVLVAGALYVAYRQGRTIVTYAALLPPVPLPA
jgi:hypothetical protein